MSNHNRICKDGIHNGLTIKGKVVIDSQNNATFGTLKTGSLEQKGPLCVTSNVAAGFAGLGYLTKMGIASAPGSGGNAVPIIDVATNGPMVLEGGQICVGMSGYGDGTNGPGNEYLNIKAFGQPVSGSGYYGGARELLGGCFFQDSLYFNDWDQAGGVWGFPDCGPIQKNDTGNVMYIGATTNGQDWETGNVVIKMTVLDMGC